MPAPVPAFLTEDLISSLASSISPCSRVLKLELASATRLPMDGCPGAWVAPLLTVAVWLTLTRRCPFSLRCLAVLAGPCVPAGPCGAGRGWVGGTADVGPCTDP